MMYKFYYERSKDSDFEDTLTNERINYNNVL